MELSKIYKERLIKKLNEYSERDYVIYNEGCINSESHNNDHYNDHYMCFHFFEEWNLYYDECIEERMPLEYIWTPEQRFNYYLLINPSFYRTFKKMNLNIDINYMCYNDDGLLEGKYYKLFPDVTKFMSSSYNKKRMNYNGVNYIRLKLKAFSNTFITNFCLTFPTSVMLEKSTNNYVIKSEHNSRNKINSNNIKIMAIPIKKKYNKTIFLNNINKGYFKLDEIPFPFGKSDKLTLKYSDKMLEDILEDIKEKKYYDYEIYAECWINVILYNEETLREINFEIYYYIKSVDVDF